MIFSHKSKPKAISASYVVSMKNHALGREQNTCFPTQLLPKGNDGKGRSKEYIESWSQYPDRRQKENK